jgi:hypothetical protein
MGLSALSRWYVYPSTYEYIYLTAYTYIPSYVSIFQFHLSNLLTTILSMYHSNYHDIYLRKQLSIYLLFYVFIRLCNMSSIYLSIYVKYSSPSRVSPSIFHLINFSLSLLSRLPPWPFCQIPSIYLPFNPWIYPSIYLPMYQFLFFQIYSSCSFVPYVLMSLLFILLDNVYELILHPLQIFQSYFHLYIHCTFHSIYLPVYLSIYLPTYLPTNHCLSPF